MKTFKKKLSINKILFLSIFLVLTGQSVFAQSYVPPVMDGFTTYNKDYYDKMVAEGKPTQETPWGFQEIYIKNAKVHNVSSIDEYIHVINFNSAGSAWVDGKTHIINFASGEYIIPNNNSYYILKVPSRTIIQGAGMGETIFKAVDEIAPGDTYHYRTLFNLEFATHDVVLRDFSFYNETKDNKWSLLRSNGSRDRENYLFENIEFDDGFGSTGKKTYNNNFITFRGLRKRIGNTTQRINDNFTVPVPNAYQFHSMNDDNVSLAGQVGMRTGNSVVFHDCVLGDAISATIDIYNNYIEMVGISFIDPLHDHSVKCPNGNHLYIHDCTFNLRYSQSIMQDGGYWNPTFFTHEGGQLANYHFKDLEFTRAHQQITAIRKSGATVTYIESEPFMIYDNRANNISGDMVWENISFNGYSSAHQVVGYPYVQADKGFQAINYTSFVAKSAQMRYPNLNWRGNYTVTVDTRTGNSKEDITGVYSWGQKTDGTIDFPRDNRTFDGTKSDMENQPYVKMNRSTVKKIYNARLAGPNQKPSVTNVHISGTPEIGQTLTLNYDYSDPNGDVEGETIITWRTTTVELQSGTSNTYLIPQNDPNGKSLVGDSICAIIYPKDVRGLEGDSVEANNCRLVVTSTVEIQKSSFKEVTFYPNPVKEVLFISSGYDKDNNKVVLYNALGQVVLSGKFVNNSINVSNLKKGVYFIRYGNEGITKNQILIKE